MLQLNASIRNSHLKWEMKKNYLFESNLQTLWFDDNKATQIDLWCNQSRIATELTKVQITIYQLSQYWLTIVSCNKRQ